MNTGTSIGANWGGRAIRTLLAVFMSVLLPLAYATAMPARDVPRDTGPDRAAVEAYVQAQMRTLQKELGAALQEARNACKKAPAAERNACLAEARATYQRDLAQARAQLSGQANAQASTQ